jgi:hypothetical protein
LSGLLSLLGRDLLLEVVDVSLAEDAFFDEELDERLVHVLVGEEGARAEGGGGQDR